MKNLLVATDFSENATHAAEYGYQIAAQLKTNIILSNAFFVPVEIPQSDVSVWPPYDYEELLDDCKANLKRLAESIEKDVSHTEFKPQITYSSDIGTILEIVKKKTAMENIGFIVMGTHGSSPWNGLLFGNHSRKMIDNTPCPLLLVPPKSVIAPVKKIAFATDFEELQKDTEAIYGSVPILHALGAQLVITHIYNDKGHTPEFEKQL
jgi:nucleotide-binding universal stress UspA family protein